MADNFQGDNAKLIECINALLSMDAAGSLRPHGVGGHGRKLLQAAASRLAALSHAAGQEAVEVGTLYITDRYVEFDIQREAHDLIRYHKQFGIGAHSVYLTPAQPPASAEVVARAVGISRSWEGGGRTSVTFDGSFEVPLLETYRIVPVASSGRKGGD